MSKVYVFLADGFEEIEGLTVVDLMRRAGIEVTTVSIKEDTAIEGSHHILLRADTTFGICDFSDADMLVLPGGGLGTENLEKCEPLGKLVTSYCEKGGKIAAICAAPRVFAGLGLLNGKKATCYPSVMEELTGAVKSEDAVVVDGNITTSRGLGTAIDFSLELITQLISKEKADEIAESVVYKR